MASHSDKQADFLEKLRTAVLPKVTFIAICYFFPTLAERFLLPVVGPWIADVVLSDIVPCIFIAAFSGWILAVVVYSFSSAVEAILLLSHVLPASRLLWITDLVPALVLWWLLRTPRSNPEN